MAEKPQDDKNTYIDYRKLAGIETQLDTEQQQHDLDVEFNRWIASGKPRPEMPKMQETPIPMKLYRIKYLGRQKLFWKDTKGAVHDRETTKTPIIKKVKDAMTGKEIEVTEGYNPAVVNYLTDYTKAAGEYLVEDALARCNNPTFYILAGADKILVGPKEFNKDDFDELVDRIRKDSRRI